MILMVQIVMFIACSLLSHTVGPMAFFSGKWQHMVGENIVSTRSRNGVHARALSQHLPPVFYSTHRSVIFSIQTPTTHPNTQTHDFPNHTNTHNIQSPIHETLAPSCMRISPFIHLQKLTDIQFQHNRPFIPHKIFTHLNHTVRLTGP